MEDPHGWKWFLCDGHAGRYLSHHPSRFSSRYKRPNRGGGFSNRGEELEIDPLVATYVPPSERYRRMRRSPVDGKQRGISLEAATHPVTEATFQPLLESNVTWIVQTPFGWQSRYNSPRIRLSPNAGWWGESDMGIAETTQMAREFGIHTLLKPHVWLSDRSDGKWRAQIEMDSEADWQQWFAEYRSFMLHYARLAEENDIEALCIGTELHRAAVVRPADWRELIAAVRQEYSGELTYAANWYSEYQEISFWDALDYIGIQAYFPLTEQVAPSVEELKRGWGPHLAAIEAVQRAQQKPVLFTEVGYHSTVDGAIRPWEWDSEDAEGTQELGLQTQANCYEALFQIFWSREWFAGAYFWKWHADDDAAGGPNYATEFTPQNKPAEQVMAKWYAR